MPHFALRRNGILALLGIVVVSAAIIGAQAPAPKPADVDRLTAEIVVAQLERHHLSKPTINDEIARKWARNYIEALDPQKYYFEKPDVDAFLAQDTTLDDQIHKGDITFAKLVFDKFLQRHDERSTLIKDLLKQKYDFTVDESIVDDPEKIEYPADAKEANERWRKRIKLDLLVMKVDKVEEADAIKQLATRYNDRNRFWRQFDNTDLLELYLTSLTTAVDPHTSYMGSKQVEDLMNQTLHLSLEGIGASLQSEGGFAVVKEIVPGGAADKDGRIQPEDKIVGIVEADGKVYDLFEKKLQDVVRKIRGPKGTKVTLVVQPAESKERTTIELTRAKIELKDAHAKSKVIETKVDGKTVKIGVIDLVSFYGDTAAVMRGDPNAVSATEDCRKLLKEFQDKGVNAVLLDLRRNGGGLLTEAISLSGLFIDRGPVVQVREARGVKHLDDDEEGTAYDGPLAVLISRQSASASEIFAGVIKDYKRGLIVGDSSTFGKGTVQSIVFLNEHIRNGADLPNLGALKLTIQQFYRADGESTQIRGVTPDIHIPSLLDQLEHLGEGKMHDALKFDTVPALPHDVFNKVPKDLVARLDERSAERRASSDKFKKQAEVIKKYNERKASHLISLNEEKYRAEVLPDDEDADDEEVRIKAKSKKPKRFSDRQAWESNFYNDEVISIVADYVTLGSKALAAAPVRSPQ